MKITKTTDRELLELAAKAAGLTTRHRWNAERLLFTPPVDALVVFDANRLLHTGWDPLTDNWAALWLVARLRIAIEHNHTFEEQKYVTAIIDGDHVTEWFDTEEQRDVAMRRAIVRVAADTATPFEVQTS